MQYSDCLNLIFSNRKPAIGGVKDRSVEENQEQEFVEALEDANYKRCLSRINELKNKYMPETKDIRPPKVVKIEPLVPIDCFLNISLTRRGFKKCKFHGKPFAKITQPLYRRVSFDVFEGLWKIKDSKLERDSRPKIPRDVLERAAKFFKVPLDDFNCRLLTRLLKHYEEEKRIASAALLLRIGPCPIWRVSLLEIMQGLEKALHCKKEATIMDMACALTLGRFNVSNWHTPDVPRQRKGKRDWQDPIGTTRSSGNKSKKWHQVKEYVMFMADPCWHIYCIK